MSVFEAVVDSFETVMNTDMILLRRCGYIELSQ